MRTTLRHPDVSAMLARLGADEARGPAALSRQPVHTYTCGGHQFRHDTHLRVGEAGLDAFQRYAPDCIVLARTLQMLGHETLPEDPGLVDDLLSRLEADAWKVGQELPAAWLAHIVYVRVLLKLEREPVEDLRIDFDEAFGVRDDDEEDATAASAAVHTARAMRSKRFPPFFGIRTKPLDAHFGARAARTLDVYLSTLLDNSDGSLPPDFIITVPGISEVRQVQALVSLLAAFESTSRLPRGSLRIELAVEHARALIGADGRVRLPELLAAAGGRCRGVVLGGHEIAASVGLPPRLHALSHPTVSFARQLLVAALAGRGPALSDGVTVLLPIPPHSGGQLAPWQARANAMVVHEAWRESYANVRAALDVGLFQGQDAHAGQLAPRYAATFAYFLQNLRGVTARLGACLQEAAQAAVQIGHPVDVGGAQALLQFLARGLACGALLPHEVEESGLTVDEVRSGSFADVVRERYLS